MFSLNKTIVCVEFSKNSVFCALAQISGRKVDIVAIDHIRLEGGILEEGVIYDIPHLQQLTKNLITSVSKTQTKIDEAWIAIPDNKISITKFEVEKERKGVNEQELHKAIEEKFNFSASKLHLINRPIHELNKKVFFLSNAIRTDHLNPFLQLFEPLNIRVTAIFPTFQCIYEDLKEQFVAPTLLLYPSGKGFKFFLADSYGVHMESVWGHNIIEFNDNFDKAIDEIIQYSRNSKEIALVVRKLMVVENSNFDTDLIQTYLQRTGVEYSWVPSGSTEENSFDPISIITLKGLIKSCMMADANKGFMETQVSHSVESRPLPAFNIRQSPEHSSLESGDMSQGIPSYTTRMTKNTLLKGSDYLESRWNWKVVVASVLLAVVLIGGLIYAGKMVSDKLGSKSTPGTALTTPTPTPSPTVTETPSPTSTVTPTPTVTVTIVPFAKSQVLVQVLNGNSKAGQAGVISGILQKNGFKTKTAGNNPTKVETTTVTYKDVKSQALAEDIVKLIEGSYPSAKAVLDSSVKDDILVVLGTK